MLASAFLLPADYADRTDYWHPRAFLSANYADNTDYWHPRYCCRRIMRIELIIGIRVIAAGGLYGLN